MDPEPPPFPPWFFTRADELDDARFYDFDRFVTHIDDEAIAALGQVYADLGVGGRVLDLMASWVSHLRDPPDELTVLGMNRQELEANPLATTVVVHDLNATPALPFETDRFDAAVCTVSVDYLIHPIEVFAEVARVLVPGSVFACTFSNRCFPTKAIRGWLMANDAQRAQVVAEYFQRSRAWTDPELIRATPPAHRGDPLFAVWARVR